MNRTTKTLLGIFAVMAVALCCLHFDCNLLDVVAGGGTAIAGVAAHSFGDVLLKKTKALPTGASAVTSDGIDLGQGTYGSNVAEHEFLLSAPAVTTAMLGDAATIKYDVISSVNSDMSSPTTVAATILTQTGAGGAGAAAATQRFRLPTDCKRYIAVQATKSAAGNASSVSLTLELLF